MNQKKIAKLDTKALSMQALDTIIGGGGKNSKPPQIVAIKPIQGGFKVKHFYPQYQYFPYKRIK